MLLHSRRRWWYQMNRIGSHLPVRYMMILGQNAETNPVSKESDERKTCSWYAPSFRHPKYFQFGHRRILYTWRYQLQETSEVYTPTPHITLVSARGGVRRSPPLVRRSIIFLDELFPRPCGASEVTVGHRGGLTGRFTSYISSDSISTQSSRVGVQAPLSAGHAHAGVARSILKKFFSLGGQKRAKWRMGWDPETYA